MDYFLTISDLYRQSGGVISGETAEITILARGVEVDRLRLSGKIGPGGAGHRARYKGRAGLTVLVTAGSCKAQLTPAGQLVNLGA